MAKPRRAPARDAAFWVQKKRSTFADSLAKALPATRGFMRSGDWSAASPIHFVVLHVRRHESIYGVEPVVNKVALYVFASKMKEHFGGDPCELAAFMYWAWLQEESRVQWMRETGVPLRTGLTVRRLFSEELLTGYRIHLSEEDGS